MIEQIKLKYLAKDSYLSHFLTMAGGRIVAQSIPIVLTPVLTRLYLPSEFGLFAIFLSVVAISALIANGRYTLAIMLPKEDREAMSIFVLSNIINIIFLMIMLFFVFLFKKILLQTFHLESFAVILYLFPIATFLMCTFESLYSLSIRQKFFKTISINLVFQFTVIVVLKIFFAYLDIGGLGLILAHILGYVVSVCLFFLLLYKKKVFNNIGASFQRAGIIKSARIYKKFPIYSLPGDTIQVISRQIPNFLLSSFFGTTTVGNFSLTQRVLGSPISLISSSIADVFREKASYDYRETESCRQIFLFTFKRLFFFGLVPFVFLFLFAPAIVPFIFGVEWAPAGDYIRILTLLFFLQFVISPILSSLYITGKQVYRLVWEVVAFVTIVLSFYIGYRFFNQNVAIALYSFSLSFLYIILLMIAYKFTENKLAD